jgi:hypothetical protein
MNNNKQPRTTTVSIIGKARRRQHSDTPMRREQFSCIIDPAVYAFTALRITYL